MDVLNGRDGMCNISHLGRVSVLAVFFLVSSLFADYTCTPRKLGWSCYPSCSDAVGTIYANAFVVSSVRIGGGLGYCVNGSYSYCELKGCNDPPQDFQDSVNCEKGGDMQWVNGSCKAPCDAECECEEDGGTWDGENCNYEDLCAADRASCGRAGGKWSGTELGRECCSSTCDLCDVSANQYIYNLKKKECCQKSMAPPNPKTTCYMPLESGCGMTTSQWQDLNSTVWDCVDPNKDSTSRARFYDMCFGEETSSSTVQDDESSSSMVCEGDTCSSSSATDSTGSSSSASGSGSSSDSQGGGSSSDSQGGGSSSDSQGGGTSSGSGSGGGNGPGGDGDSTGSGGSGGGGTDDCPECPLLGEIIGKLREIGGDVGGILACLQIPHLCSALDPDYSPITQGIEASADSSRKYLSQIAGLIGVTTDSLLSHLDSILRNIPDSVLDSILKYQKYAADNFDSVIYGMGQGFGKVDSLIDSAVKYFKISNTYDSMYRVMFSSFDSSFNSNMNDLPGRSASAISHSLGYGDTASTNLRGDLNAIREAIEGIGDGLGGDIAGALDSAWGNGTAAEGSGFESYGSDSASYVGVLDGLYSEGTTVDSAFMTGGDTCSTVDCIVENSGYNVDSMGLAFKASLDTQYMALEDSSAVWFDSIRQNLMFVDFDSILIAPLRQRIPNTNTCPEDCFSFDVGAGVIPGVSKITYPICRNFSLGGFSTNGLLIVRLILRILAAMCCIYIGLWYIAGRKG